MLAFGMLGVEGFVENSTRNTICHFRDAAFDETVNVERDGPHCNRFVSRWKSSDNGAKRER